MPETQLDKSGIESVLRRAQLVRVAFMAETPYVITLGCTYLDGCLVGITSPGRKSELAARDRRVGFQVDTSVDDGVYAWDSVHGEGTFEISQPEERVLSALRAAFPDPPQWFIDDRAAHFQSGTARTYRIQPTTLYGVHSGA